MGGGGLVERGRELTVEMNHPQGLAVGFFQGPQRRQREAVVAAEGDEPRAGEQRRCGASPAQLLERFGHLDEGQRVVHGRDGDVAAVDDLGPALVRVDIGPRVEAPERSLPRRRLADGSRPETSALVLLAPPSS